MLQKVLEKKKSGEALKKIKLQIYYYSKKNR